MQQPIKLGPLALLLTVITICLTTLAILTLTTARADLRLAEKYADTVAARYELERMGQAFLQDADNAARTGAALTTPGAVLEGDTATCTFEKDGTLLTAVIRLDGKKAAVAEWKLYREWTEDLDLGNLWPGS